MVARSATKDLVDLQRLAEDQGWTVEYTGSGHLQWRPPFGEAYTSSSTPSHQRTIDNIKAELKRRGMITNRSEWRRYKRESSTRVLAALKAVDDYDALLAKVIEAGDRTGGISFSTDQAKPTPDLLRELAAIIDEDGKFNLVCACGRHSAHPLGHVVHLRKCTEAKREPDPTVEEEEVERNMAAPPERERLNCPECPEWFWISRPGDLAAHVKTEHGKEQCPYCLKWWKIERGGHTKHVRACPARPVTQEIKLPEELVQEVAPTIVAAQTIAPPAPKANGQRPKNKKPYLAQPHRYPAVAKIDGLGEYNPSPCGWCGRPIGQMRGYSRYCWNPVCWEMGSNYASDRKIDVEELFQEFKNDPKAWVMKHVDRDIDQQVKEVLVTPDAKATADAELDAAQALAEEVLTDAQHEAERIVKEAQEQAAAAKKQADEYRAEAKRQLAEVESYVQERMSSSPEPSSTTPSAILPADASDDDLWTALGVIIGSMPMNKDTFVAVNQWMESTRKLLGLRES